MTGSTLDTLHKKWLKRPGYRKAYKALEAEFDITAAIIEARARAGLTQEQLARRMLTTREDDCPSGERARQAIHAHARTRRAGERLKISFEPARKAAGR